LPTASNSVRRARPLLGTFVEIEVHGTPTEDMDAAIEDAFTAIARVHALMSFHEQDSDVGRLNRLARTKPVTIDVWTLRVLRTAMDLQLCSAGAFDVTVASVLQEIGLLPSHGDEPPLAARKSASTEAIELMPDQRVRFSCPSTRIDLGGIAKGFAVDRAIEALRSHGVSSALVTAGGDVAAFGPHPWRVGIRDPRDPRHLLCRVELRNAAIASSGASFDPFESTEPIGTAVIDPRSCTAVREIAGATARASSCMMADALTKVLMVRGCSADAVLAHHGADAMLVFADGGVRMTRSFERAARRAA
jgi:FAD:protein FMN transferase